MDQTWPFRWVFATCRSLYLHDSCFYIIIIFYDSFRSLFVSFPFSGPLSTCLVFGSSVFRMARKEKQVVRPTTDKHHRCQKQITRTNGYAKCCRNSDILSTQFGIHIGCIDDWSKTWRTHTDAEHPHSAHAKYIIQTKSNLITASRGH